MSRKHTGNISLRGKGSVEQPEPGFIFAHWVKHASKLWLLTRDPWSHNNSGVQYHWCSATVLFIKQPKSVGGSESSTLFYQAIQCRRFWLRAEQSPGSPERGRNKVSFLKREREKDSSSDSSHCPSSWRRLTAGPACRCWFIPCVFIFLQTFLLHQVASRPKLLSPPWKILRHGWALTSFLGFPVDNKVGRGRGGSVCVCTSSVCKFSKCAFIHPSWTWK